MLYKNADDFRQQAGYVIDGFWYPRVTSILSIKSKPGLYMYYAGMPSYHAAEKMKVKSAEEGSLVHEVIESILKKENPSIPDSIKPSVDAFNDFINSHDVEPIMIEERIISRQHKYAGTIDILAKVDGKMGVLDLKTSRSIYRDYGMQTAAYVEALHENPATPLLTSWVLRIDQSQKCFKCSASLRGKGGVSKITAEKYPCEHEWDAMKGEYQFKEIDGFEQNIKAFLAAKTLWEWEHEALLRKI